MRTSKDRIYGKTKEISHHELIELFKKQEFNYIKVVLLFGSRANNSNNRKSDYDFAIDAKESNDDTWGVISKAWNDIGDILDLPVYDYDIVNMNNANPTIIESIKENFIILKGEKSEIQRLFNQYNSPCQ